MVVFPEFLYLFQTVPIFLPKKFFKDLDVCIGTFIWNKSIPHVRKSVLERRKADGDLVLPIFLYYCQTANVHKLTIWYNTFVKGEVPTGPLWNSTCAHQYPQLCAPLQLAGVAQTDNHIMRDTLHIWTQFHKHLSHTQGLLCMSLTANPLFKPSLIDPSFQIWFRRGPHSVGDLFTDGQFGSFEHFVEKYKIPRNHFFRYLQICDFTRIQFSTFPSTPVTNQLDDCLRIKPYLTGCVSYLYCSIQKMDQYSLRHLKTQWEGDLGIEL